MKVVGKTRQEGEVADKKEFFFEFRGINICQSERRKSVLNEGSHESGALYVHVKLCSLK